MRTDDGIVSQPLPSGSLSLVRSHAYCMVGDEGMCATPRYAALGTQIAYVVANLSQPLRVQVNGAKLGSEPFVRPDVRVILEDARTRGDRQHPFWAKLESRPR